ncbi:MAG: hypothetical protein ACYDCN_05300 [Bacteroidia bacterium]
MKKDCLYCGVYFTSKRVSRKYCSDNCKQMAYFIRNGLVLAGVSTNSAIALTENRTNSIEQETNPFVVKALAKSDTVKYEALVSVKPITVKYPTEVPTIKYEAQALSVKDATQHDVKSVSVKPDTVKYPTEVPTIKYEAQALSVKDATQHNVKPVSVKQDTVKYPTEILTVKDTTQHEAKPITVKDATQHEVKPVTVKSISEAVSNDKAIEAMLSHFMITMEQKFNQAIDNLKQEFSVKYDSLIVKPHFTETESDTVKDAQDKTQLCRPVSFSGAIIPTTESLTKIKYCAPCKGLSVKQISVTENTLSADDKSQQEHFTVSEIKEEPKNTLSENKEEAQQVNEQTQASELPEQVKVLELADDENKNQQEHFTIPEIEETIPKNTLSENKEVDILMVEPENKSAPVIQVKEEKREEEQKEIEQPFKWVEPKLICLIEEKVACTNEEEMLKDPLRYWSLDQTRYMFWMGKRLRCLIESIIRLSNYNRIDKNTLLCITDAFTRLVQSKAYKNLPDNFPYTELIKELCIKLNSLVQSNTCEEQIRFTLSPKLKSTLIITRYKMLDIFSPIKFSELDFTEEKSMQEMYAERAEQEQQNEEQRGIRKDRKIRAEALRKKHLQTVA